METVLEILMQVGLGILSFLKADWWILLLGTVLAVVFQVYLDPQKIQTYFNRRGATSIVGAVAVASLTPLCACGTMAVLISLAVSKIPWAPVLAFLVTSPLASPSGFVFNLSFFGTQYAIALFVTAIVMGLLAGFLTHWLENSTNFFKDQFRQAPSCGCGSSCSRQQEQHTPVTWLEKLKLKELATAFYTLGIRKILLYFVVFIAIGQLVQILVPADLVMRVFSAHNRLSIPLAATIGLPLYVSGPAALPVVRAFAEQGADLGAVLAFMIAGKATGVPVLLGMSAIIKPKLLLCYVTFVYFGAIVSGLLYSFLF